MLAQHRAITRALQRWTRAMKPNGISLITSGNFHNPTLWRKEFSISGIHPCSQCSKIIPGSHSTAPLHFRFTLPPSTGNGMECRWANAEDSVSSPKYLACIFIICLWFKCTVTAVDHNINWQLFWIWLVYTTFRCLITKYIPHALTKNWIFIVQGIILLQVIII